MVFRELNKKNAVLKQDLEPYVEKIINYTDEINGGFKGAPKFPQFYIFDTILHFYNKTKNKKYLDVDGVRVLAAGPGPRGVAPLVHRRRRDGVVPFRRRRRFARLEALVEPPRRRGPEEPGALAPPQPIQPVQRVVALANPQVRRQRLH